MPVNVTLKERFLRLKDLKLVTEMLRFAQQAKLWLIQCSLYLSSDAVTRFEQGFSLVCIIHWYPKKIQDRGGDIQKIDSTWFDFWLSPE